MDKQAYEASVRRVLEKRAADAPAMVGYTEPPITTSDPRNQLHEFDPSRYYNPYFKQLVTNSLNKGLNTTSISPDQVSGQFGLTFKPIMTPETDDIRPILFKDLLANRRDMALTNATYIFGGGTAQAESARKYLMERGVENHKRFINGTLWKNEPTKVPLPKNISNPTQIEALDRAGRLMTNTKRPASMAYTS